MSEQREEWRDVPGYEGHYMVSSLGRVKSLKKGRERFMKLQTITHGYLQVGLTLNGKTISHMVHSLVARAFIGERPDGYEINHRNRNKQLNTPENLEYMSRMDNMYHATLIAKDGSQTEYARRIVLYYKSHPEHRVPHPTLDALLNEESTPSAPTSDGDAS